MNDNIRFVLFLFCVFFLVSSYAQNDLNSAQKSYIKRINSAFNLKVKTGQSWSKSKVKFEEGIFIEDNQSVNFDKENSIRFGIEMEFIFASSNKWSAFVEPTYDSYNSVQKLPSAIDNSNLTSVKIDYSYIEVPVGIRHHMYYGRSKLFLNFAVVLVADLNNEIDYEEQFEFENDLEIKSDLNLVLGFGYSFNERFSLEYRISTTRDVLSKYASYQGPFKNSSLILGFRLF
ncbi:outer membrane beta-barrel protein [Winogradskyella sp. PE311]|uniref:outer membrane beta-barrel protein n=1 Tax=Winogradskyella sp. PE311 TaxID=3366943 RepID=UPI00397FB756